MAKQEITFDTNNIYINGKKHSAKTYKTCSTLLYILAIIALIIGIPTFIAGGFIFVIIALFCIWLGRKYGSLYRDFLSHRDHDAHQYAQNIPHVDHVNYDEHISYMQYNDSLRSAVDKYYTGMENIQAMWSVMYNLKITTGEKAEQFENACYENIEDLKTMIAAQKAANFPSDIPPQVPAFVRLAMLYEKQQRYEEAINVCVTAIKCGATHDGNKGKMYGRLARLIKKSGITPSAEIESLLIEKK